MQVRLYKELACRVDAYKHCLNSNNTEWQAKHYDAIQELVRIPQQYRDL